MFGIFKKAREKARKNTRASAIILAGGSSTRMGNGLKQFMMLDGKPVLAHTLLAFENCRNIDDIIIVSKSGEEQTCFNICKKYNITKLCKIVAGGATRQESAYLGFKAVPDKSKYIAIHDGARPLITPKEITNVIIGAREIGCAVAGYYSKDTVKLVSDSGFIEKTLDRSRVWLAQTPQVFYKNLYEAVAEMARRDRFEATDDVSLAEHYSHKVLPVECSQNNIKITFKDDITVAEAILKKREEAEK